MFIFGELKNPPAHELWNMKLQWNCNYIYFLLSLHLSVPLLSCLFCSFGLFYNDDTKQTIHGKTKSINSSNRVAVDASQRIWNSLLNVWLGNAFNLEIEWRISTYWANELYMVLSAMSGRPPAMSCSAHFFSINFWPSKPVHTHHISHNIRQFQWIWFHFFVILPTEEFPAKWLDYSNSISLT